MRFIIWFLLTLGLPTAGPLAPARPGPANCGPAQADSLAGAVRHLVADSTTRLAARFPLTERPECRAFYARRNYQPAWSAGPQLSVEGQRALTLLTQAEDYGLPSHLYHTPALRALADSLARPSSLRRHQAQQARFEVLLTDGLMHFVRHLRRGRLRGYTPSPLESQQAPFTPAAWLTQARRAPHFTRALLQCQPPQREYQQLQQALMRWRRPPAGLTAAGRQRTELIALNLERWRWYAISDPAYVLVNLPAYTLAMVPRTGQPSTQRVLIGHPRTPTPTFSSTLSSFTLAPEWIVPREIVVSQLLPYLQNSALYPSEHDFLADNNYLLYDAQGRQLPAASVDWPRVTPQNFSFSIHQKPGCGNLLGTIIFNFANPYGLYFNDAPEPVKFQLAKRAVAEGCVQLEQPRRLAAWLLGPDSTTAKLPPTGVCAPTPLTRHFVLKHPVPLHVRYATCAVAAGRLQFYADVYGQDVTLRRQLFNYNRNRLLLTR